MFNPKEGSKGGTEKQNDMKYTDNYNKMADIN